VPGQLARRCLGVQAEDDVQVLRADFAERHSWPAQGQLGEGILVAAEDAPVEGHVCAVERMAQSHSLAAAGLAVEHDHLTEAEPLDLIDGGLVPSAYVALVEYDPDPDLDQLLEQRDPAVCHGVG
jgi:hypothetical protein